MFGRSKPIRIAVFGKTDLGRTRDHNEDRFLVADLTRKAASLQPDVRQHDVGPRGTLLVVADGMGGAAAGEVASEMATDTIYAHLLKTWNAEDEVTPQRFAYRLKEAVEVANASIHAHAKAHPEVRGMGTTSRVPDSRRRGVPDHQGPVADAATGGSGRADGRGSRTERAP